ncbi:MAG: hypothetical protein DYG93_05595 [Leptolyngbya sp. PLA2]|nr:hypothetical protein [Leptolyngbya sp.]MCE7971122.1 hypothetical protein [Leptolyngbya sp. PL-A2]MCQ3940801.1 hypothetical protein [cyanobacterium CYA1]GIK19337.1 MAG: hypothetical protein BroJett004_15010 [Planctomycetota bacterium]
MRFRYTAAMPHRAAIPPERINALRAIATLVVRGVAVWCLGFGAYLFLKKALLAVSIGDLTHMFRVYMDDGDMHSTSRGLALMVVGSVLALLSRRVAGWVVPVPATGCPRCGYPTPDSEGRCPECGLPGFERDESE